MVAGFLRGFFIHLENGVKISPNHRVGSDGLRLVTFQKLELS
jgi:hypothetical protein